LHDLVARRKRKDEEEKEDHEEEKIRDNHPHHDNYKTELLEDPYQQQDISKRHESTENIQYLDQVRGSLNKNVID